MTSSARIDVLEDDRGLRTCFEAANVSADWSKLFMTAHKIETLDDFVYLVDRDKWESSIKDLLEGIAELRNNRLILARFKAAFESGVAAIKASQAAPKMEDATDQILPEATLQSVTADFQKRYGLVLESYVDPSDALRSRIYREFRRGTMSLLEAKRVKSMINISIPKTQDNIKLSDSVRIQFQEDETVTISSAIEYYLQLRTLVNAWAWAGQFESKDHDGQRKIFIGLGDCLNYADFALRATVEHGQGSLQWMSRNDALTRSKMASLIRRGYVGSSALREALLQTHLEWRSPAYQQTGSAVKSGRSAPPPEPDQPPAPKRPRQVKADAVQTVSMVKGGKRLCKAWNDNRGCRGSSLVGGPSHSTSPQTLGSREGVRKVLDLSGMMDKPQTQAPSVAATVNAPAREVRLSTLPGRDQRFVLQACAVDTIPATKTSLSDRIASAKPVVWRGRSDIPQFSWANHSFKGSWLVLDLWGGYSGLCIACLSLGVHFFAVSAESDPEARACASQAMPNIVHLDAVEKLQVRDLRAFFQRRSLQRILIGGGSPCQGNSVLNLARQGLSDLRSQQPKLLAQLVEELTNDPALSHVEVVSFLENVGSAAPI
eukprot:s317_g3.t1